MEAYTGFARVYDGLMDNIPYDEWSRYLLGILKEYGVEEGIIADLGCGTGNITEKLWEAGYDMIGLDNAEDMLEIARDKAVNKEMDILYLHQDMRRMELFGTVKAAVSICDSMNYILLPEELLDVFRLVNNYLDRGGIFIFDLNTGYKYREILGENTFAENRDEVSFIWENYYDEESRINEYDLTIYVKEKPEAESYLRFEEEHYQRAYELEEIKELLNQAGLEFLAAYDAFTRDEPREDSERIYVIAREAWQEGKYYE